MSTEHAPFQYKRTEVEGNCVWLEAVNVGGGIEYESMTGGDWERKVTVYIDIEGKWDWVRQVWHVALGASLATQAQRPLVECTKWWRSMFSQNRCSYRLNRLSAHSYTSKPRLSPAKTTKTLLLKPIPTLAHSLCLPVSPIISIIQPTNYILFKLNWVLLFLVNFLYIYASLLRNNKNSLKLSSAENRECGHR